jgi:hypothetical protein
MINAVQDKSRSAKTNKSFSMMIFAARVKQIDFDPPLFFTTSRSVENARVLFCNGLLSLAVASIASAGGLTKAPAADTTITEQYPGTPQGGNATITAGTHGAGVGYASSRALLQFNLNGSIPSNAVVTATTLNMKVIKTGPGIPPATTMDLRKMLRTWGESSATWSNCLPSTPWSTNGAAAPVDFSSAVSQTISVSGAGSYSYASNPNLVADVQSWVSNPGSNFGWIIISESQGTPSTLCLFGSREDPADAPSLIAQFTIPATPPMLAPTTIAANQFQFNFNVESNRSYAVEYCGEMPGTNWNVLTTFAPLPSAANVLVSDPLTGSNRFYRVRTP